MPVEAGLGGGMEKSLRANKHSTRTPLVNLIVPAFCAIL